MKKIIFLTSIFSLILILCFKNIIINHTIFSCGIINNKEYKSIIKNRNEIKEEIVLYYNDNVIPYSKSEDFYLLSTIGDKYLGKISNTKYKVVAIEEKRNKKEIMASNSSLKLLAYNDQNYKLVNLKLTNLPVVNITNKKEISDIIIYDNITNENHEKVNVYNYNCNYHIRGNSSQNFKKKSYKLNIINKKGKKEKVNLLNMRFDDDWILNGIFLDNSFMREKIGYEIWNKFDKEAKYNVNYVELFIDNEYLGLYCLMDPVDMKKFNSNKNNDLLITVKNWSFDVEQKDIFDVNFQNDYIINEFEFDSGDYNNFLNVLRGFVSKKDNKDYELRINYDIDNATNYDLFLNLILSVDNSYKNTKVLFKKNLDGYTSYLYPWDLDWSQLNSNIIVHFNINAYLNVSLLSSKFKESDEYKKTLENKYFSVRDSYYNMDYLNNLIDNYVELLSSGGSASRNSDKWDYPNFKLEVDLLKEFYKQRINVLDNYFGGKYGI